MTEERQLLYRFIDRGPKPGRGTTRYLLQCFTFYPNVGPKGTPGRGPYCIRWFDIKASDRKRAEREISEKGFIPAPEGVMS